MNRPYDLTVSPHYRRNAKGKHGITPILLLGGKGGEVADGEAS